VVPLDIPKLLIFIPTFNREQTIERQLSRLLPQIRGNSSVQVMVSDNSSSDETWSKVNSLTNPYENAGAQRTPSNVGGNANALLGFSLAVESEYIWVLSDDTIVANSAVDAILDAMKSHPNLISVKMLEEHPRHDSFDIRKDGITEVFESTSWGQFGSLIYSRKFIGASLEAGFGFHDSSFPHLAILFDACWKNGAARIKEMDGEVVFSSSDKDNLSGGVYSLSLAGRSSLLHYANDKERTGRARRWARANSLGIAAFQDKHPLAVGASIDALVKYGGLKSRWSLLFGRWLYVFLGSSLGKSLTEKVRTSKVLTRLATKTGIIFFTLPDRDDGGKLK